MHLAQHSDYVQKQQSQIAWGTDEWVQRRKIAEWWTECHLREVETWKRWKQWSVIMSILHFVLF